MKIQHQTNLFTSLIHGSEAWFISECAKHHRSIMYIAKDDADMTHISDLCHLYLLPEEARILTFPAWDCLPYDRVSPNPHVTSERIQTLCNLVTTPPNTISTILITTVNAITQRVPPKSIIEQTSLTIKTGITLSHDTLIHYLVNNSYQRVSSATEPGEFAVRGHIIDIFPPGAQHGYRLDFFGDDIETIRTFDPFTQITTSNTSELHLHPASEILLHQDSIEQFRQNYRKQFGSVGGSDPLYDAISAGRKYAGMEHWLPLFYEQLSTLYDYVHNPLVIHTYNIESHIEERTALITEYYHYRSQDTHTKQQHYRALEPNTLYINKEQWHQLYTNHTTIDCSPFASDMAPQYDYMCELPYKKTPTFTIQAKEQPQSTALTLACEYMQNHTHTPILIHCSSIGSRERLSRMLQEHALTHTAVEHITHITKPGIYICTVPLEHGFETNNIIAISEQDILGEKFVRNTRNKRKKSIEHFIQEAASLVPGEHVVHKEHGIGKFSSLETLEVNNIPHDFMLIIYANDDKLYVPIENIDLISRYGNNEHVMLDKLGHTAWQARKATLQKRIQIAAEELLRIAAEREVQNAPTLIPLASMYDEFCARFPYVETDDQLNAIEDIAQDLRSGHPMDRLVCGDVGFGKTEVALRAAFMAISSEHTPPIQVAVVAPTTLLARQHFLTFQERFSGFPIKIRQLSRLVTAAEAKQTREEIKEGKVDIIIGTHALLAKSIKFHNLGLLIVDEEQHFGVAQKERLKSLKENVHVLTLTATPIPRTLQMSLSGIKTLSLIATPPVDRLAVRTYVMPYDSVIIREAILREYHRGGRCFYVCPRINQLDELAEKLTTLVPEIKLVKAHGQMPSSELDNIVTDFYDGKYDMLLSTTIVESGLDVPAANTIFIHRADMFGLSQLYQLRGRVGRGKIRAYAYLTLPPRQHPTKEALKRLEVMQSLDSLGAGFSVASHDMDIRGFGNLVGEEQSGHIREVGIELYQDMLKEAVEEAKQKQRTNILGEPPASTSHNWSPTINVGLPVLIPERYISDLELRLGLYRRLSYLSTHDDVEMFAKEMIDRFGPIPTEVEYLFSIVKLKPFCWQANIEKIDVGPKGTTITFKDNHFPKPEKLLHYIHTRTPLVKLRPDQKLVILHSWQTDTEKLEGIENTLQDLCALVKDKNSQAD